MLKNEKPKIVIAGRISFSFADFSRGRKSEDNPDSIFKNAKYKSNFMMTNIPRLAVRAIITDDQNRCLY